MSVRSSSNKQQPEQSLLLEQHQHHHQHHRIFFFTAAISGLLGALASVFAKLASNTSPATGGIIYSALCHALAQPLDVDTTNSHNTISDPCNTGHPVNALKLYYQIATLLRLTFVACTVMANAAMWKIFTHALTQAAASVHVTIITSAANMLTTVGTNNNNLADRMH
ncbi:hypothetical protein BSLG_007922 [Batrachochytrium salamandrivorans]|nr:hypothetical protein BSLG_007922 [Batrachochytrium salamandrivorans]